jgi:hypothetical protein
VYIPGWGDFIDNDAKSKYTTQSDGQLASPLKNIPIVGSLFPANAPYSNPYGAQLGGLANELDFSSTVTAGINGGINAGATIPIKPLPIPISINMSFNVNGGANGSSSLTGVTVRMMDIDGDGFVDQVLRIPGKGTYAKLNLGAKVGLLKKITLPQGGTYELAYEREGNTTDMPQSRYVLASVTMKDHETERGGAHSYTTKYTYANGYYDRMEKEFYGFGTVKTSYADNSTRIAHYRNDRYYAKGMEISGALYNETGAIARSGSNVLDGAPYARVIETVSRVYDEETETYSETGTGYEYDGYGNVSRLSDHGDMNDYGDDLTAAIT